MNLHEQISRIQSMMGVINENIDDILDKMNNGEELSKEDKIRMDNYTNHLSSGGKEKDFDGLNPEQQKVFNDLITKGFNYVKYSVGGTKKVFELLNVKTPMDYLHLFDNMNVVQDEENPKRTLYRYRKGETIMMFENNVLYVSDSLIMDILSSRFGIDHWHDKEIIIKKWMLESYNFNPPYYTVQTRRLFKFDID